MRSTKPLFSILLLILSQSLFAETGLKTASGNTPVDLHPVDSGAMLSDSPVKANTPVPQIAVLSESSESDKTEVEIAETVEIHQAEITIQSRDETQIDPLQEEKIAQSATSTPPTADLMTIVPVETHSENKSNESVITPSASQQQSQAEEERALENSVEAPSSQPSIATPIKVTPTLNVEPLSPAPLEPVDITPILADSPAVTDPPQTIPKQHPQVSLKNSSIEEENQTVTTAVTSNTTAVAKEVIPIVPATIKPSLTELLRRSQPQIEQAIKSGNFAEAYYLWRPLAEAGDPSAQYGIGWMYHNGYGLSINDQKAYEWWGKAAAQNYVEAIFSIGTLYQFGYGALKKDSKIALSYYLMAAVEGHEESQLILKTMLQNRDRSLKPILPAMVRYYLYSATSGDEDSKAILKGMLLNKDDRIKPIVPQLLTDYRNAAITGNKEAQQLLRTLMLKGDPRVESIIAELLENHPKILGHIPATVRVKRANTRMGPGTQHKIIKVVKQGDELTVIDRENGWLLTQISGSDKRVWISEKLVNLNP